MQPTNICLIRGTKLRLSISAAAYPAIGVNPGFGKEMLGRLQQIIKLLL